MRTGSSSHLKSYKPEKKRNMSQKGNTNEGKWGRKMGKENVYATICNGEARNKSKYKGAG